MLAPVQLCGPRSLPGPQQSGYRAGFCLGPVPTAGQGRRCSEFSLLFSKSATKRRVLAAGPRRK